MFLSRHKAIVAGLTLSLSLGGVAAPKALATPPQAEDKMGDAAPEPTAPGTDKALTRIDEGPVAALLSLFSAGSQLEPVALTNEMKYFCKYESRSNYDQGFSKGDGYNAMGFYQFDRRYGLGDFMEAVYNANPTKYHMLKAVVSRKDELKKEGAVYNNGFTELGNLANSAWHAAYAADPAEFSAFQDSWAYNEYFAPVQRTLKNKYGVDISDRADCVKGLAWGMSNLFGPTGATRFFDWAVKDSGMSDKMSDRELVMALTGAVIDHVVEYRPEKTQYHKGWINRYKNERTDCLRYIAEDEAQAQKPAEPAPAPDDQPSLEPEPAPAPTPSEKPSTSVPPAVVKPVAPAPSDPEPDDEGDAEQPGEEEPPANNGSDGDHADANVDGSGDGGSGSNDDGSGDVDGDKNDDGVSNGGNGDTTNGGAGNDGGATGNDGTGDSSTGDDGEGGAGSGDGAGGGNTGDSNGGDSSAGNNTSSQNNTSNETNENNATSRELKVTYRVNGAVVKASTVKEGEKAADIEPGKSFEGYKFVGWYHDKKPFDFEAPVTGDIELVAYFQKVVETEDGEVAKAAAEPTALPQTGDPSTIFMLGAAGAAMAGASLGVLGIQRRKEE